MWEGSPGSRGLEGTPVLGGSAYSAREEVCWERKKKQREEPTPPFSLGQAWMRHPESKWDLFSRRPVQKLPPMLQDFQGTEWVTSTYPPPKPIGERQPDAIPS